MPNLRDIKKRIVSVQSTRQITRTMEMVATAKIKKAQERIESARPYALAMMEVLATSPATRRVPSTRCSSTRAPARGRHRRDIGPRPCRRLQQQHHPPRRARHARAADAGVEVVARHLGKKALTYFRYRGSSRCGVPRHIGQAHFADARSIADHVIPGYVSRGNRRGFHRVQPLQERRGAEARASPAAAHRAPRVDRLPRRRRQRRVRLRAPRRGAGACCRPTSRRSSTGRSWSRPRRNKAPGARP